MNLSATPEPHFRSAEPAVNEVAFQGLSGDNPLAFLAALGTFRILANRFPEWSLRLRWVAGPGHWVPAIRSTSGPSTLNRQTLLDMLSDELIDDFDRHPANLFIQLGPLDDAGRRAFIREAMDQSAVGRAETLAWITAFTSDAIPSGESTQLQTVRRDYLPNNMKSVIERTERSHLERTLFRTWDYGDALDNQSLHWDPGEDRRHAHQWNKPSGDPNRKSEGGMLGANRLALEAIPLFTSIPENETLRTLGFTGTRSKNTRWTWPLWDVPVDSNSLPSLMARRELQGDPIPASDAKRLKQIGVVAAFRTYRILVGKTPNLTPPRRVA